MQSIKINEKKKLVLFLSILSGRFPLAFKNKKNYITFMKDNNSIDIPDLNQALSLTEQYEEYKYLRVWGLFILIDAIVVHLLNLSITLSFNLIYLHFFFEIGLRIIQYIVLLILLVKIGRTEKITRLKLGKIHVAPHWAFFFGLLVIQLLSSIFNLIEIRVLFLFIPPVDPSYFVLFNALNQCITMTLYYIFMKKMILKHNFKEIKNAIFFFLGWIGIFIIMVFIVQIDEYFGWDEIIFRITPVDGGASYYTYLFMSIVNASFLLIFLICEATIGIIAFKKSKELLGGENSEIS